MSGYRLDEGGLIARETQLKFTFDGKAMHGYSGDTLASALLANGIRLFGRSFKYHRPRGLFSDNSAEPNALITTGEHDGVPNLRATMLPLRDGLSARSQNRFPSLRLDLLAFNDYLAPFLGAGFYYKTFMWPARFWEWVYEPAIRRAAGLGSLPRNGPAQPDDRAWAHCDLLVIGAGPSGLAAALLAARSGARVLLCDEDHQPGGRLNSETLHVARIPGSEWAARAVAELASLENVTILTRTTVFGCYDGGLYAAIQAPEVQSGADAFHTLWRIQARRTILAAGAQERGIAFADNDRPGIMLSSAVRGYVNRYAASPGRSIVLFGCNHDNWRTASDLRSAGVNVEAIVDTRPAEDIGRLRENVGDVPIFTRAEICATTGRKGLQSVTIRRENGTKFEVQCDCLAVSGGWNPNVHLTGHLGGRPVWSDRISAFVPGSEIPHGMSVAGAASGAFSTHAALASGVESATAALRDLAIKTVRMAIPEAEDDPYLVKARWRVESGRRRAWVDLQNDVTEKDICLSHQEGFRAAEHVKRYTTLGMGTDQGKTANVTALGILSEIEGRSVGQIGTTTFRPPYTPVPLSALAGTSRGRFFRPTRLTPAHDWAHRKGAIFTESGLWMRAQWFPREGESHWRQSCDREARTVRKSVGFCDVSTLGKIDVQGKDAAAFLDLVYCNMISTLQVGRVRYGLMLREDGFAMDDGTVARLAKQHFLVTTTTANAASVMAHLDYCAQVLRPGMNVQLQSVTDQYAQFAVAGPRSRETVQKLVDDKQVLSNENFPYMACCETTIHGVSARLFRISFSGELAYEIAMPARHGSALAEAIEAAGAEFDICPYGVEALNVLRIEKGHPTGGELNGQTTAFDLGLGRMISSKKDCIGKVLASRPALHADDRMQLVGFKPVEPENEVLAGAHFVRTGKEANTQNDEGWVSSACFSPSLGHCIGLGFLRCGPSRHGEVVRAVDKLRGRDIEVEICPPHFIDPKGERLRV